MGEALVGAALGLKLSGAAFQAHGAKTTSEAIEDASNFNAKQARKAGALEAARIRRFGRRQEGLQKVHFAKAGVQLSGSPLEFMVRDAEQFERDAVSAQIDANATAALDESRADNARTIGRQRSLASLITGVADAGQFGLSLLTR